ncbi:hypothetical protein [Streptomyces sp. SID14515]|uniref:hypothetical protein n=1 Tax=Streptomyces sp. SID14515 TaxID=2706074 RepID=UPI001EF18CE9|nr:hypothetical protein [Streptomyces sp. SID14515]
MEDLGSRSVLTPLPSSVRADLDVVHAAAWGGMLSIVNPGVRTCTGGLACRPRPLRAPHKREDAALNHSLRIPSRSSNRTGKRYAPWAKGSTRTSDGALRPVERRVTRVTTALLGQAAVTPRGRSGLGRDGERGAGGRPPLRGHRPGCLSLRP